ncbi:UNVERIFIED_CONTAM: hypothetical protein LK11_75915 [Mumia flava]
MIPSHLSEDRYITSYYRQFMLGSLDKWQAKTFAFRGGDQAVGSRVDFFEVFVTDAVQPEQASIALGMVMEHFNQ